MSFQLTIEPLGETIDVDDRQTILDAALRAGIWLPYACNHGLCGTCKVDIIEGEVDHNHASAFALMDIERDERKTLACCATLESDIVVEAEIDEEPDAAQIAVRDFTARVSRIEELTPTIKGIWLDVDGHGVTFQAGQYINLTVAGLEHPRAFSIASIPSQPNSIQLNVRRVEDGEATSYIHEELKVSDQLTFTAPFGRFFVRKSAPEPIIFLAGGSGLSGPKSMILELLEAGDTRPITLLYGARNREELYYYDLFSSLADAHENFSYRVALSDAEGHGTWDGALGFVHDLAEQHFAKSFSGYKAYLCGPPSMIDACITVLMKGRLFEEHIFMESFLTAADGVEPARRSALFKKF
ncbi:MAG: 2Fe-2S iron-sulfur cluster binding domain-containing protein [Gammaproteobacteria bacterium]